MNKIFFVALLVISIGCAQETHEPKEEVKDMTISVVYDNNEYSPELKLGFGFGCVTKIKNKTILFDTGGDSPTLLANMETMGIKPEEIEIVVLSHIHADHAGGLLGFLEKNSNVKVYALQSFPDSFKKEIKTAGAELTEVSGPAEITENVFSTGELGDSIKEQSLIISTDKGLVIITGCAHPGIVSIIRTAKEQHNKNIYLVLGGFHHPSTSVVEEFRKLGVENVAPCHCTGDVAIQAFEKEYKDNFIKNGVGKIIKI